MSGDPRWIWSIHRTDDDPPMAFIQWKGTKVCMDIECLGCGEHLHVDERFAYYVSCKCGTVMEMRSLVEYREVPEGVEPHVDPVPGER